MMTWRAARRYDKWVRQLMAWIESLRPDWEDNDLPSMRSRPKAFAANCGCTSAIETVRPWYACKWKWIGDDECKVLVRKPYQASAWESQIVERFHRRRLQQEAETTARGRRIRQQVEFAWAPSERRIHKEWKGAHVIGMVDLECADVARHDARLDRELAKEDRIQNFGLYKQMRSGSKKGPARLWDVWTAPLDVRESDAEGVK